MSDYDEQADSLEGEVIGERYQIEKLLGSGGMGAVYRGTHIHMRKAVAVKVLHREMTAVPEVVARFEREAVAAARIEHPHVAGATDFGQLPDGSFYLILEFIEGKSLGDTLAAGGVMPAPRALHITKQIVSALGAAHASGIVHRDLKPDNVMLVDRKGDQDFVKVLDFGIAKLSAEDTAGQPALTQVGSVFGTPEYMSPEQAKGETVDARSDLYTAGILLYEMLAGRTPFAHDDMLAILTGQMTQPPPPLPPDTDPRVAALVMTQLQKDPAARIQTADEMLAHIDALGMTPEGMPPSSAAASVGYSPTVLGVDGSTQTPASSTAAVAATIPSATGVSAAAPTSAWLPAGTALAPPRRGLSLGGISIPIWAVGVAALGLSLVGTLAVLLVLTAGSQDTPEEDKSALQKAADLITQPNEDDELAKRATAGDREALGKLQQRPESDRNLRDWRALGRGLAQIKDYPGSVAAYGRAAKLDPSLAENQELLRDIRRAMEEKASSEAALDLCASALGSSGPDLLYDLYWSHKKSGTEKKLREKAKDTLDAKAVRAKASPALKIALDLASARGCGAYKKLLAEAAQHADARSDPFLRRLQARRGCGFLGLADCYSCVRGDANLGRALARAGKFPGPDFTAEKPRPAPGK